jgi:hypothetical protein
LDTKFMNCFEWRCPLHLKMGTKPPLYDHNTSCFSKEKRCFYMLFYSLPLSAILSNLAHDQEQHTQKE